MAQRLPLSQTEKLQKLEQQITLTLQEIDHNFNRSHRVVTTSLIPIVERYGKESAAVLDSSKFWKQFFEASANVALSNYQELEEETYDQTQEETTGATYTHLEESTFPTSSPAHYTQQSIKLNESRHEHDPEIPEDSDDDSLLEDSLLESLNLTGAASHSTPKAKRGQRTPTKRAPAPWANIESPFETLKKELSNNNFSDEMVPPTTRQLSITEDSLHPPSTPRSIRRPRRRPPPTANPETPESSAFYEPPTTSRRPGEDQLLHRVLDKNWRLQATPMVKRAQSRYKTTGPTTTPRGKMLFRRDSDDNADDDDPFGDADSPQRPHATAGFSSPPRGPKTPVAKNRGVASRDDDHDEDSDDDSLLLPPGYSPPVTIQFSLPPSKLLATPAREASRRIVRTILQTAGAVDESAATDDSPSFIRSRNSLGDDTF
ncbi:DASH complex subunit ask1 [Rhizina undulata]